MAKQPIEIVRMVCEDIYGKGKIELIPEAMNDDFVEHDPLTGRRDRSGVEQAVQMYRSAFPDMTMQVVDSVQGGDVVTARWRAVGTHKGELLGIAPTNKRVTIEGISMIRFENGKAKEAWVQWDALGMMRTLGALPEPQAKRPDGGGARAPGASRGAQRR